MTTLASETPKITEWLQSATAVVALLVASVAAWANVQTNRKQSRQLQRLEDAQQRELASGLGIWIEYGDAEVLSLAGRCRPRVMCHNSSGMPFYHVQLTITIIQNPIEFDIGTLGPTSVPVENPELSAKIHQYLVEQAGIGTLYSMFAREIKLSVKFRDGNGLRWMRNDAGMLTQ